MRRLYILTFISVTLSCVFFACRGIRSTTIPTGEGLVIDKSIMLNKDTILTPIADCRPTDQTFLTFPEWYLVFSPAEQAEYFKTHTATNFPYITHISQFWRSNKIMKHQIKGTYKYNFGYNFMIKFIGVSTTLEYGFKSVYENTVGRLSDLGNRGYLTEEDKFYAKYMDDYTQFIRVRPWYEFNFISRLPKLWAVPYFKKHPIRKIERKLYLTTDILFKTVYGFLIKLGTKTAYEVALPTTVLILDKAPQIDTVLMPKMKVLQVYKDSSALVSVPRYEEFIDYSVKLSKTGATFKEIAGNNSVILISVIVPNDSNLTVEHTNLVFTQLISSTKTEKRLVYAVPVHQLHKVLLTLDAQKVKIEHVFDY